MSNRYNPLASRRVSRTYSIRSQMALHGIGHAIDGIGQRFVQRGGSPRAPAIPYAGTNAGIVWDMPERKITVHVPEDLLDAAQKTTGQGITETVRQGLRLVAAAETFRRLSKLRGTVRFSVDLKRLREDRS